MFSTTRLFSIAFFSVAFAAFLSAAGTASAGRTPAPQRIHTPSAIEQGIGTWTQAGPRVTDRPIDVRVTTSVLGSAC